MDQTIKIFLLFADEKINFSEHAMASSLEKSVFNYKYAATTTKF